MPVTLEQIIEETRFWSPEKVGEVVIRLTDELNPFDSGMNDSWKAEIRRRLAEVESSTAQPEEGDGVSLRISPIVGRCSLLTNPTALSSSQ